MQTIRLLLSHDLRLGWREFRSHFKLFGNNALAALVLALVIAMHAAAWSTGTQFAAIAGADDAGRARVVVDLAPLLAFLLLLMLAQTLSGLTKTLYGRGDLDLILSSPYPAGTVLAVRVAAVGLGAMASAALFAVPVMDVALLHGGWRSLALAPVLLGAGLASSGIGLVVVMVLFAVLGPRRTRLAAQIVATFIGGGFMVWLQVRRFLPEDVGLPMAPGGPAWVEPVTLLPARAAAGEGDALVEWLLLGGFLFAAAVLAARRHVGAAVAASTSLPERRAPRGAALWTGRFDTRLHPALRAKEWRLLRRDPWLISQLLLQVLYMTPMLLMLTRGLGPAHAAVTALAPMIVVLCYQVTASLTWLSLSAEDAPELLATAPVTAAALRLGKLKAVGTLAAALAALPLAWLATLSPRAAAVTVPLAALGVVIAMTLSLFHIRAARRSTFAARHRESKLLALMEMVMSMLLGLTAALAVVGSLTALLPLALAGFVLLLNRPRRSGRRLADDDAATPRQARQQPA